MGEENLYRRLALSCFEFLSCFIGFIHIHENGLRKMKGFVIFSSFNLHEPKKFQQ